MVVWRYRKSIFTILIILSIVFICYDNYYLLHVPRIKRKIGISENYDPISVDLIKKRWDEYLNLEYSTINSSYFQKHQFNNVISTKLPIDRQIPDTRNDNCQNREFYLTEHHKTSVIISFYNEAASTLLRTVTSILKRTPNDLLQEIILIDDCSDNQEIDPSFLEDIPTIKLLRNEKRQGLIRSRNIAAKQAQGDYLLFLDSHCEVNIGWLEPLVDILSYEPTSVLSPIIDVIDINTLEYKSSSPRLRGAFDWSLRFQWLPIAESELQRRKVYEPFYSPAISGGVFIITKEWFTQLGQFDEGMDVWGGESLELSIKNWLCGGNIQVVPCSRIGHIFRRKHPYTFPPLGSTKTFIRNTKRVAEIWLDEFKNFFYDERPEALKIDAGSLVDAKMQKNRLNCRPFRWYLQNVFTDLKFPNDNNVAFGLLRQGSKCLEINPKKKKKKNNGILFLIDCNVDGTSQWTLNRMGELRTDAGSCVNVAQNEIIIFSTFMNCDTWSRIGGLLVHRNSKMCLENFVKNTVGISNCRRGAYAQLWSFSVEIQHFS